MVEQNPGMIAMKQTRPSKSLFLQAGKSLGSFVTGIFICNKLFQYVIFRRKKKEKKKIRLLLKTFFVFIPVGPT